MKDIKFPDNVERVFDSFSDIAKGIDEHPIVIGGFIRDFIANGSSDGDIDVVLRYGKNFTFVNQLKAAGATDSEVFGNTGTLYVVFNDCEIEVQSSDNPLVHFNIDSELQNMGVDLTWINRNVYERDFTINTIIYDPLQKKILDVTGTGITDLTQDKVLKCPIDPRVALNNNPIIVTRAIKFAIDFGLSIDPWFMQSAPAYRDAFVERINMRSNRHYMKSYIRQTFDMDFDKTYEYYENIGFLDIIPVGEELQNQIQQRKMGIVYRKPINMKRSVSSYPNEKEDIMTTASEIQMRLDQDQNVVYANFAFRDLTHNHKKAFLDLLNQGKINSQTSILFLDHPKNALSVRSVIERGLTKEAVEIEQHLYDSIKGKQEYKERKKKEHKKKTLEMYKVLDKVRKILDKDGFIDDDKKGKKKE